MFGDRHGRRRDGGNVGKGGLGYERQQLGLLERGEDGGTDEWKDVVFSWGAEIELLFGREATEAEEEGGGESRGDGNGDGRG